MESLNQAPTLRKIQKHGGKIYPTSTKKLYGPEMNLVLVALELLARMGMLGISLSWGGGDRRMGRSTPELCPNPEQADVDPKFQVGAVPSPGWHLGPVERSWCPLREGKRRFHLLGLPQELTV